jgi:hypothetical protein
VSFERFVLIVKPIFGTLYGFSGVQPPKIFPFFIFAPGFAADYAFLRKA